MVCRVFLLSVLVFVLFSCGEIASNSRAKNIVLELDSLNVIRIGKVRLYPILNKRSLSRIVLNSDSQKNNKLELSFDLDLKSNKRLTYSINNGETKSLKSREISLDILEGNNVVFVSVPNELGLSSSSWVKNYFVGQGSGNFDTSAIHLFQNISRLENGSVLDYYVMNQANKTDLKIKCTMDTTSVLLPINQAYWVKKINNIRVQLVDSKGNLVDGPFNDTGVIQY